MNKKHVSFEIAKLLKEKGFSWEVEYFYKKDKWGKNKFYLSTGIEYDSDRNCIWDWNLNGGNSGLASLTIPYPNDSEATYYSAPEVHQVVDWLYEKYGIWIVVNPHKGENYLSKPFMEFEPEVWSFSNECVFHNTKLLYYNSPIEAYEAAIIYTLNNLIK